MKLNFAIYAQILSFYCLFKLSFAIQDDCPRVQTFFDFQDINDQEGHKEVTAITHIQGSTLVAIGTRVGAIEIWDYDSREIITKFFEDQWPIVRIDHISHTNHIVVRYQRSNGSQVSIWDLVTQERTQWIVDESFKLRDYSDVLKYKVIDTYLSRDGNFFLQMSYKHVVACDIHNINSNQTQPLCDVYPLGKTIQDEKPRYIFSFDSQFENEFYILTKSSLYKIDRNGLSLSDKIYRVEDENSIEIVDMIRIYQDGIIMIALSTNELLTFNLQTNNGSEKIYKLRDYLQYISLDKISILKQVKSFFSESLVLILFQINDQSKQDSQKQIIMTYNINEDKVLQFQTIYQAKFIAPINQSRSFLVVFNDDTVGWFAYPVVFKQLPLLSNANAVVPSPSLDLQSNQKRQILGLKGRYLLQDDLQGKIIIYNILENSILKKVTLPNSQNSSVQTLCILSLENLNQFIVITSDFYIIIYSYDQQENDPYYVRDISPQFISQIDQSLVSNTFMIKLRHSDSSIAIITGQTILIFDYTRYKITHKINSKLTPADIFIDCDLIYDINNSNLTSYKYFLLASGQASLKIFNLIINDSEIPNDVSTNIIEELIFEIPQTNIVGWEYIKESDTLITQDARNEFCRYKLSEQIQLGCFRVWYDETGFQTNIWKRRGLLSISQGTVLIAQLNDLRVVFIDILKGLSTFSSCKFDVQFYQISQPSLDVIILIPPAISKKKVILLDYYSEKPINNFRTMNGVISESKLYKNKIVLNMKDGSFKVLNVEGYKLYDLILADPKYQDTRKFLIDKNTILYIDSSNYLYKYTFDNSFNFVSLQNKFLINGISVTNTTRLEPTSIENVIAFVGNKQIIYINYVTREIFPIYNSYAQEIVSTDFNSTLSLIVIGLNDNRVQILNVENFQKPFIANSIYGENRIVSVHHSVMFLNRIYFTYSNKIIKWEVLTGTFTEIQLFDNKIKQVLFVQQLQAIVVFLKNGVVQIINDDKNLFYFINVYALTQSYANVDQLIYMNSLNSIVFVSDHRIWALTLHNFVDGTPQNTLTQTNIQCEKGFYIESMQGQDYFNVLGQGTLTEPYKSVSAIRKETIKIGKSHKIFLYNMIKLNFFLQEGKNYQLEEPFQYATQKINSIVTFKTYKASPNQNPIIIPPVPKKSYDFLDDRAIKQPTTTLSIKNSYRFENIQKLFFYNMNMQIGSAFNSTEDVRNSIFNNIDSISFIGCNFNPNKNNYDVYIFEEVQLLKFIDVKIKQTQFLSSNVKAIYLEKVDFSLIPPQDNNNNQKKCLAYSQVLVELKNKFKFSEKPIRKYLCKYYFFYPTNSESYLFIEIINSNTIVNNPPQSQYLETNKKIQNTKQSKNPLLLPQEFIDESEFNENKDESVIFIGDEQINDHQSQQTKENEYSRGQTLNNFKQNKNKRVLSIVDEFSKQINSKNQELDEIISRWTAKNSTDFSDEDSYLKLNKTLYNLFNCTFQYARIFTFVTTQDFTIDQIKPASNDLNNTKNKNINGFQFLTPQLNISNSFIRECTIFNGQEIELDDSYTDYFSQDDSQKLIPTSQLKILIKNHIISQSQLIKVNLYDSTNLRIKLLQQLRMVNNTFDKLTMQLGKNKDTIIKDIILSNNTFESFNNIPLFELGQRFLLSNIILKNNSFTNQVIFSYKSEFESKQMSDEFDEDNSSQINEIEFQNQSNKFDQNEVNNSTISKIQIIGCQMKKATVFSLNELLLKSILIAEDITLFDATMVETKIIDIMNLQKSSQTQIKNLHVEQTSQLRSCFIRKLSDQVLIVDTVYIHRNIIRYSNFLQTKRQPSLLTNKDNFLTNIFKNISAQLNHWFNSKLAELTSNSLLFLTNSLIQNNTLTSEVSSYERQSKYFLELDHLLLDSVQVINNQFFYQLLCGPPMVNNQFVDYSIKYLNVTNNTFTGQSNALLVEATFSILSRGSQVRLNQIYLKNNIRKDSSITRGTFLVEGYRFFFFHFDKIQNTQVIHADMYNNIDIGFGVFKNSIGYNFIDQLKLINDFYDPIDLNINIQDTLKQPILIIRNGANFTVKNSIIKNLKIFNSPVFEIESNKNFYTRTNLNSTQNQASMALMQVKNVTFENNVIQIDPYLCLGSIIDYTSNLITQFQLYDVIFKSNVIKGLNQNSLIQAQLNIAATQSEIYVQNSFFIQNRDNRFVKNIADSIFLQIESRQIIIKGTYFSSTPNNQKDEENKSATKFNTQVIGLMNYQQLIFKNCTVKSMRSQNFGILDLNTISDNSVTEISDSIFEDLIPKNMIFDLKGNLFSSQTIIKNCSFSLIFSQIINLDRISYLSLRMLDNIFYQVFSHQNTLLNIINTEREISSIYFKNNQVLYNYTSLQVSFGYYSQSAQLFEFIKSRTNGSTTLLNLTQMNFLAFQNNTLSGYYSNSPFVSNSGLVYISNIQQVIFENNTFKNIKNAQLSILAFTNIESVNFFSVFILYFNILFNTYSQIIKVIIKNLVIFNCSQKDEQILLLKNIFDVMIDDVKFYQNQQYGIGSYPCIQIKNTCFRAKNLQIYDNKCNSDGPLKISFTNKLSEYSRCQTYQDEKQQLASNQKIIAKYPTIISNSIISKNIGYHYGALFIQNTVNAIILLKDTKIQRNKCEDGSGGGLFIQVEGSNNFLLENTTISNNYASYRGGGIYIDQDIPQSLIKYNQNQIYGNISPSNIQICTNGRVVNFKLTSDKISIEHTYTSLNQENILKINDQQSGGDLPTILAEILDNEGQKVLPGTQKSYNIGKIFLSDEIQNQGYYLKGDLEVEYNLEKGGFLFQNISIYGKPDTTINLNFATKMIEYEGLNSNIKLQSVYKIQIQVMLRKCIVGEVYFNNNLYESCQPCPEKEFSLEDPYATQQLNCLECPKYADCPGRNQLSIHKGYWRKDINSLEIIYCGTEPGNCKGGLNPGNESCADEMKGPLCEQCDIERGYTNISSSKCLACSEIGWTLTIILSVLLFFLIYILISIDSTVRRIKHSRSISSKSGTNTVFVASMVVKLFISYLQVVSILGTFQLNINPFATQGALSLGNPILSFSNAMDCYLYTIGQQIGVNHIYLNFFSSLLIPLTFMLFISLVDYLNNRRNYYYRSYFCKTMFLVILLIFAPLAFQNGLKLITCRKVGSSGSYITQNMLYECFTTEYFTYSMMVVAPLTFIICVIFPFILAILIKKRKQRKVSIKTYQYLLGDYKETTYYWEFVKYTQKLTIMMISVYFQQDIKTKALFINLILIIYGTVVFFVKPFRTEILNRLDIFTTLIIFLSIHFGLMAYEKSDVNNVQWYFCIIFLSIMNIPLFSWYIYTIFKCYAPWFAMKKRNMKICLMRFRIFRSNQNPKERAQFNWKNLYKKYIEAMKSQKLGGREINFSNTNDNEFDHIPFLRNIKNISFNSESTDPNNITISQTREEEITNHSEAISDYDEESPVKVLNLKFRRKQRNSFESPNARESTQFESHRKRFHTSGVSKKKKLSIDQLNESYNVHSRFSQLIQDLKTNQVNPEFQEPEQQEEKKLLKREKSHDSGDGENFVSDNDN